MFFCYTQQAWQDSSFKHTAASTQVLSASFLWNGLLSKKSIRTQRPGSKEHTGS